MSMAVSYSSDPPMFEPEKHPLFTIKIEDEWFDFHPSAQKSASLAVAWRKFWQYQARLALEAASEGLNRGVRRLLQTVNELDLNRRLSPRISSRLATLMEAMSLEDGYGVFDTLQAWINDRAEQWYADQSVLESVATQDWEASLLREIRSTHVEGVNTLEFFPLLEEDLSPYRAAYAEALHLIQQIDAPMHAEIQTHVSMIKLFDGRGIEGLSSPKAFGAIWIKAPDHENALSWFLEHLVHECSHLHLNALMAFDPLLNNPNEINSSPLRPDPRPMFQVLHATFVLSRNKRVHERLHAQYPNLNLGHDLQEFTSQLNAGVSILKQFMRPTARGQRLLDSMDSYIY